MLDVRDPLSVEDMLKQVTVQLGVPTILVDAAIGELEQRPFAELGWEPFRTHLAYQVKGCFIFAKRCTPA